jgi:hypothetical protein
VRGDDEVALADAAVWCDVRAFDRAIAAGKLDEAVSLYGGDLLPGFFVSTAVARRMSIRTIARWCSPGSAIATRHFGGWRSAGNNGRRN